LKVYGPNVQIVRENMHNKAHITNAISATQIPTSAREQGGGG